MKRGAACLRTTSGSMCNPGGYRGVNIPFFRVWKENPGGNGSVFRAVMSVG